MINSLVVIRGKISPRLAACNCLLATDASLFSLSSNCCIGSNSRDLCIVSLQNIYKYNISAYQYGSSNVWS